MKKIVRNIREIWYQAEDGKKFYTEELCRNYEEQMKFTNHKEEHFNKLVESGLKLFDGKGNVIHFSLDTFIGNVIDSISMYLPTEDTLFLLKEYLKMTGHGDLQIPELTDKPKVGLYIFEPYVARDIPGNNDPDWVRFEDLANYMKKIETYLSEVV